MRFDRFELQPHERLLLAAPMVDAANDVDGLATIGRAAELIELPRKVA